jgi:hypothetical protein
VHWVSRGIESSQINTKFGLIWVRQSFCFLNAFNESLLLAMCTVAINVLDPRAFNPESLHFIPIFNKISWLCAQTAKRAWSIKWGVQGLPPWVTLWSLGWPWGSCQAPEPHKEQLWGDGKENAMIKTPRRVEGSNKSDMRLRFFSWTLGSALEFIGSRKMCSHLPDLLLSIVLNVSKNTEGRAGYSFGVRDWMSGWQFCSKLILP